MVRLRNKPVPSQAEAPSSTPAPTPGPLAPGPSASGSAPPRNAGMGFTMAAGWSSSVPSQTEAPPSIPAPTTAPPASSASSNVPPRNTGTGFTMAAGWSSRVPSQAEAPSSAPAPTPGPLAPGPSESGNAPPRNTGTGFTMAAGWSSAVPSQAKAPSTPAPTPGPLAPGPSASGGTPRRNTGIGFNMAPGWSSQPPVGQQALPAFQPPSASASDKGKRKVDDSRLPSAATPPQADTPSTPAAPRPGNKALPPYPPSPHISGLSQQLGTPSAPPAAAATVPSSLHSTPLQNIPLHPPPAPLSQSLPPPAAPPPLNYPPQTLQPPLPPQWAPYTGSTASQVTYQALQGTDKWNSCLAQLEIFSKTSPESFQLLVGLWFKETGRSPQIVGHEDACCRKLGQMWRYDWHNMDLLEHAPNLARDVWKEEMADQTIKITAQDIERDPLNQAVFEEAIRTWAKDPANDARVVETLMKANLTQASLSSTNEYYLIGDVFKMEDCEEKTRKLEEAKSTRPRFYQACLDDEMMCGVRKIVLRYDDCKDTFQVYQHRKHGSLEYVDLEEKYPRPRNRPQESSNMDEERIGRPTQVHGVPLEERAIDSQGNKLPWALEWHPDHPNARGQKRHVEEKGPFGKSNRRRGSSRTRTTTPAKKENPTLDGFQKALDQDAQSQQERSNLRLQSETPQHPVSANKTPTQVIIFGYGYDMQWAALSSYERHSSGMICEDYARDPPSGAKRYPSTFNAPQMRRARTKAERVLASRYDGGEYWVKVTFDSAEAAAHAIAISPSRIYGHWVYAQPYHGHGPEKDEPLPVKAGEQEQGYPTKQPQTFAPSLLQRNNSQQQQGSATLPRSFAPSSEANRNQSHDTSPSSTTATSATATGIDYPDLRQRPTPLAETTNTGDQPAHNPEMMRHFPNVPRTKLHPASEAFLPQPSWWERQLKTLSDYGLIPGDIIGHVVPVKEDGTVDMANASFYWKFFYWIDSHLGTDICGVKDD